MSNIVSLISDRGGVGKTTIALQMAENLAHKKIKTIVVDFSPQNSIYSAIKNPNNKVTGIANIIIERLRYSKKFIIKKNSYLSFLVNGVDSVVDTVLYEDLMIRNKVKIAKIISNLSKNYDFIIIDLPAGFGRVSQLGMSLSSHLLAVTDFSAMTINSINIAVDMVAMIKNTTNSNLLFLGIILNNTSILPQQQRQLIDLYYHFPFIFRTIVDKNSTVMAETFKNLTEELLSLTGYDNEATGENHIIKITDKIANIDYCTMAKKEKGYIIYRSIKSLGTLDAKELAGKYRSEKWHSILKWAVKMTNVDSGFILDEHGLLLSEYGNEVGLAKKGQEAVVRLCAHFQPYKSEYLQFNIDENIVTVLFLTTTSHKKELFQICLIGKQPIPYEFRIKIINTFIENIINY